MPAVGLPFYRILAVSLLSSYMDPLVVFKSTLNIVDFSKVYLNKGYTNCCFFLLL